ncbi:hypothetical protein Dimus_004856 [Dionaea muscipula]
MDRSEADVPCALGAKAVNDIIVCLKTTSCRLQLLSYNSSDLKAKSKFFADHLFFSNTKHCIEIHCLDSDFSHHVDLLNFLYCPAQTLVDSWKSVKYALNILKVAVILQCDEITHSCVQYLEANPWIDEEEEENMKTVPELGPMAMPILARMLLVDLKPCPPFGNKLKISAQEQVEYMLGEDDETQPLTSDEIVSLMSDFASNWTEISAEILCVLDEPKFRSTMWALKTKIIEVTAKVLEAVGYDNVILPPPVRVQLLRTWMPFIWKMKPLLETICNE